MGLSDCMYVRKHVSGIPRLNLIKFSVNATHGRISVFYWWFCYCDALCTSGFVDNVIFAHSGQ